MNDDSLFFVKVRELCRAKVITCRPADPVPLVARMMQEKNVSGIIVAENDIPVGVITDRDLRNKIIAEGRCGDYAGITAREIMSSPIITIGHDDFIFEAVYLMSKHNIHRLAAVDEMGRITGIVTDTDVIKYHTNTPLYFIRDLEQARTLDELKALSDRSTDLIRYFFAAGVRIREAVRFVSHINDSIVERLIALVLADTYMALPKDFAFLVLGSEGRMEQTLKTDQDNAIVYADTLSKEEVETVAEFSRRVVDGLIYIGIPECPGGIMAKNEFWRRPFGRWVEALRQWMSQPSPENILNYSMLSDLRTIYGDSGYERAMKSQIAQFIAEDRVFLAHMARNVLRFPPPVGFFGRIKLESSGPHRGMLDIKKAGVFPLTEGVKILALEAGVLNGSTHDKIEALAERAVMPKDELLELESSFRFFVQLRLRSQLRQIERGKKADNYIMYDDLNTIEKDRLKRGFEVVRSLQSFFKNRYSLDFISQ